MAGPDERVQGSIGDTPIMVGWSPYRDGIEGEAPEYGGASWAWSSLADPEYPHGECHPRFQIANRLARGTGRGLRCSTVRGGRYVSPRPRPGFRNGPPRQGKRKSRGHCGGGDAYDPSLTGDVGTIAILPWMIGNMIVTRGGSVRWMAGLGGTWGFQIVGETGAEAFGVIVQDAIEAGGMSPATLHAILRALWPRTRRVGRLP